MELRQNVDTDITWTQRMLDDTNIIQLHLKDGIKTQYRACDFEKGTHRGQYFETFPVMEFFLPKCFYCN